MDGVLQNRISPHTSPKSFDITNAKVADRNQFVDSNDKNKTSFKDLIMNSNAEQFRKRAAMKNGDDLSAAKTDAEFFDMLSKQTEGKINPRGPKKELDKDAFLKLFITQLKNQDPLNPDDSAKMAAQLAQFQGLEQMTNVNKNLEKMSTDNSTGRAIDLVDFVGKEIKLTGGRLKLKEGKLTDAVFESPKAIANAFLEVRNGAGVVVAKKPLGSLEKGDHPVEWDGKDKAGKPVRDGVYTFAVVANDVEGQDVPVNITTTVKVTGIDMQETGGSFYTELGKVGIHEVDSVGEQGFMKKVREAAKSVESAKEAEAEAATKQVTNVQNQAAAAATAGKDVAPQNFAADSPEVPEEIKAAAAKAMGMSLAPPGGAPPASAPAAAPAGQPPAETSAEASDRDHDSHSS